MLFAFALVLCFVTAWIQVCVAADQSYAPDEPIASIDGQPVFLSKSGWETGYVAERYSGIAFARTRERG